MHAALLYMIMTLNDGTMRIKQMPYANVAICKADAARYTEKGLGLSWCVATPRIVIAR